MAEKTIAELKAEYEQQIHDTFIDALSSPERIKANTELVVRQGIGALLGLRPDSFREDKWELSYNKDSYPFQTMMDAALREIMVEVKPQLIEFVKDVVAAKSFQKEVRDRYKDLLHRAIQRRLEDQVAVDAARYVVQILGDTE